MLLNKNVLIFLSVILEEVYIHLLTWWAFYINFLFCYKQTWTSFKTRFFSF